MKPTALLKTGIVGVAMTRILGASWPGAIMMGLGGVLWEAGSTNIPEGWHRWVLGIFSKPE